MTGSTFAGPRDPLAVGLDAILGRRRCEDQRGVPGVEVRVMGDAVGEVRAARCIRRQARSVPVDIGGA